MNNPLIRTENLARTYRVGSREVPALQGVDLSIRAGEFISLRGRSGSGKTTLLNCISGLDRPSSGKVWLDGREISRSSERQRVKLRRQQLGFVFQSHALLPTYSARENVDLMLRLAGWPWKTRQERVEQVLTLVGLKSWMDHRPFELSGGQQQRVSVARALAPHPKIILADAPTGELDVAPARQILQLLRRVAEKENTTVLVATHDYAVDEFADRILNLQDGRIVKPDPRSDIMSSASRKSPTRKGDENDAPRIGR